MGGSRAHLDKKKLENRPKTKFCVCTIRHNMSLVVQQHQIKDWCWSTCCQPLSAYHQLKKFFIAGDDPDYCDHDFPTPGYLICLSGYMVIQHPQSCNTQYASGRNNVKLGHTGPLGLERNGGRVCLVKLPYSHILICRLIIDKSTSIWTWHNVLVFCLDCMVWCACIQHFIPYSVILW